MTHDSDESWIAPSIDIGIVLDFAGGSKGKGEYKGFASLGPIGFGFYTGAGVNIFRTVGPHFGIGMLWGQTGFIAFNPGVHFSRRFGIGLLFPIWPVYGTAGAEVATAAAAQTATARLSAVAGSLVDKLHAAINPIAEQATSYVSQGVAHVLHYLPSLQLPF